MAQKGYPAEFRRRALDLVASGKSVAEVSRLLEVSDQSIYKWRRQELIERGELQRAGDRACRASTCGRLVEGVGASKRRFEAIAVMAGEGLPVEVACRVLGVSCSASTPGGCVHPRRGRRGTPG
jgi:putative transposase